MASSYPKTALGNRRFLSVPITDIGTAGGANGSGFICPGFRGKIKQISIPISVTTVTADSIVTASIGTVAVTGGAVTVALAGTAVGNIYTATPTAANTFQATDYIKLVSDGGSSSVQPVIATVEVEIL